MASEKAERNSSNGLLADPSTKLGAFMLSTPSPGFGAAVSSRARPSGAAQSTPSSRVDEFSAAASFQGPRAGFKFGSGPSGVGYYHDPAPATAALGTISESTATGGADPFAGVGASRLSPYRKMLAIGVPPEAVGLKIRRDGVEVVRSTALYATLISTCRECKM